MPKLSHQERFWDKEAEKAVLGACLLDGTMTNEVADIVKAEDFFDEVHQEIFRIMLCLRERGALIDQITVGVKMGAHKSYLSELIAATPGIVFAANYARIIRGKADSRKIINAAGQIARAGYVKKPEEALAVAESILATLKTERCKRL